MNPLPVASKSRFQGIQTCGSAAGRSNFIRYQVSPTAPGGGSALSPNGAPDSHFESSNCGCHHCPAAPAGWPERFHAAPEPPVAVDCELAETISMLRIGSPRRGGVGITIATTLSPCCSWAAASIFSEMPGTSDEPTCLPLT